MSRILSPAALLAGCGLLLMSACEPSWYDPRVFSDLSDSSWVDSSEPPDGFGSVSYGLAIASGGVSDSGASFLVAARQPDGFGHLIFNSDGELSARGIDLFAINSLEQPNSWLDAPAMASDPDSTLVAAGMSNGGGPDAPTQATIALIDATDAQPAGLFSLPGNDLIYELAFGRTDVADSGADNVVALRYGQLSIVADTGNPAASPVPSCSHGLNVPLSLGVGNLAAGSPEDEIVFAAANGASPAQVFVVSGSLVSDAAATAVDPDVAPCFEAMVREPLLTLDAPNDELDFGSGLVIADFNGTGVPDLAIGTADSGTVYVYLDVDLDAGLLPAPILVDGVSSAGDFGAILTAGDVLQNDGEDDLIVAMPGTSVNDELTAGMVQVFNYGQGAFNTPVTLHDAQPEGNAQFGQSVAVVPFGQEREILVVGSSQEVFTYFRLTPDDTDVRPNVGE